jgi:hypothetical protein
MAATGRGIDEASIVGLYAAGLRKGAKPMDVAVMQATGLAP